MNAKQKRKEKEINNAKRKITTQKSTKIKKEKQAQ